MSAQAFKMRAMTLQMSDGSFSPGVRIDYGSGLIVDQTAEQARANAAQLIETAGIAERETAELVADPARLALALAPAEGRA